jgi:hypothetical protein
LANGFFQGRYHGVSGFSHCLFIWALKNRQVPEMQEYGPEER